MLIINISSTKLEVEINTPLGKDYVHIQARGRATLDSTQTVVPNWLARNGSKVKLVGDTPVTQAVAVASASASSSRSSVSASSSTADKE